MAIHPDDIPGGKKTTHKNAPGNLSVFLERSQDKKPTEVYNLNLSFFALTEGVAMKRFTVVLISSSLVAFGLHRRLIRWRKQEKSTELKAKTSSYFIPVSSLMEKQTS